MNFPKALAVAALLGGLPAASFGARCEDNRDFYQSLPTVIGQESGTARFGFVLKCDTVYVRKGVTTVIHPGAMLYFANPSLNSVLKVEGTLLIKGSKGSYVYLSGSLDSNATGGRDPGTKPWGGIEVSETGRLEMEYTGVVRAPTPITTFSPRVKVTHSFFKGGSGIILPDGSLMPLEIAWHAINNLDLEKGNGDRRSAGTESGISPEEKAALLAKRQGGFWTWKKALGGAAALAAVGAGAVFLAAGDEEPKPGPGPGPNKVPNFEDLIDDFPGAP